MRAEALKKKTQLFNHLAKFQLRILDDFGLAPLADETKRDLLEFIDDRFDTSATLATSQLPLAISGRSDAPLPTYAIQRVSGTDKINLQRWALRAKIGDTLSELFDEQWKPKGMHRKTFERYERVTQSLPGAKMRSCAGCWVE